MHVLVRLLAALIGAETTVGIFREIDLVADGDRSGASDPRRWVKEAGGEETD